MVLSMNPINVDGSSGGTTVDLWRGRIGRESEEMLEMGLEGELGIDLIKQVEILSALGERLPEMPEIEPARRSELRTLTQVAEAIGGATEAKPAAAAEPEEQPAGPVEIASGPAVAMAVEEAVTELAHAQEAAPPAGPPAGAISRRPRKQTGQVAFVDTGNPWGRQTTAHRVPRKQAAAMNFAATLEGVGGAESEQMG